MALATILKDYKFVQTPDTEVRRSVHASVVVCKYMSKKKS